MNNLFYADNVLFENLMDDVERTLKRYDKFTLEQRFLMLTDKLILLITIFKTALLSDDFVLRQIEQDTNLTLQEKIDKKDDRMRKMARFGGLFDIFKNELFKLEDFIQSDTKSAMHKMEGKLDEVLLGPYYAAGKEMMANANASFNAKLAPDTDEAPLTDDDSEKSVITSNYHAESSNTPKSNRPLRWINPKGGC